MKLYEITEQFAALRSMFDNGDIDEETLNDTLAGIELDFESKARNCLVLARELEATSEGIKKELDRLKALQKSIDANAEWLLDYIKINMESAHKDRLDLGLFKVTLRAPSKAVNIIDESKIPAEYFRVIPESRQVDKSALSAALKLNPIEGAELIDGKRSLLIK